MSHGRGLALPLDRRGAEIDRAACAVNSRSRASDFGSRQQHRVAEMRAGVRMRQHVREEDALIDLDAVLVALHLLALRIDLLARRHQAGNELGGLVGEHIGAHEVRLASRSARA